MAFVRVYSGDDGQSHFEDMDLLPPGVRNSAPRATTQIIFGRREDRFYDWHPQGQRQYVIPMSEGQIEVVIGDGTVRRFGLGDAVLFEDTTGRGHTTRYVGGGCVVARVPVTD